MNEQLYKTFLFLFNPLHNEPTRTIYNELCDGSILPLRYRDDRPPKRGVNNGLKVLDGDSKAWVGYVVI